MQHMENSNTESRASNLSSTSPGLLDYLTVIYKRRQVIFRITLAATIITMIYTLFLPNIYTAKTLILPTQEDKGMMSAMMAQLGGLATLVGGAGASVSGSYTTDLYVTILKSEAVKDPIIDRFKLMAVYDNKYRTDAYKILAEKVVITSGKKDGIITITADDEDPKRAAAIANAYVEELGNLAIRMNVTGAGQNRSFLEERLGGAKADLIRSEENLKAFQSKNKAVQVTAQAEATIKGVAEMRARLATQEVQLATYRRQFTESSQEVKNLVTSVDNLEAQIAKLEGGGGNSAIPSVGSVPTIAQEYIRLMREFKIQESLVELLTKQYEMARFSEAKDVSPYQVILKAKVPERKSKPARLKIILVTGIAAFLVSIVAVFVLENVARMTEKEKELWQEMGIKPFFWKSSKS